MRMSEPYEPRAGRPDEEAGPPYQGRHGSGEAPADGSWWAGNQPAAGGQPGYADSGQPGAPDTYDPYDPYAGSGYRGAQNAAPGAQHAIPPAGGPPGLGTVPPAGGWDGQQAVPDGGWAGQQAPPDGGWAGQHAKPPGGGRGRRTAWIVVSCVAVVAILAGAGAFIMFRTKGSPRETAGAYLAAWEKNDYAAMSALLATPPPDLAARLGAMRASLGVTKTSLRLGAVQKTHAPFTATLTLKNIGDWTYQGALDLTKRDRKWMVAWSVASIHPRLTDGRRFAITTTWPKRGAILAADGSRIDVPGMSGSVQQLAGLTGPATAADLKRLGSPYKKGDVVGHGGIQEQMQRRLAGTPATSIQIVDQAKHPVATLHTIPGKPGATVRTSLDLRVQAAAAQAITSQGKPAAMVAIRPSTGQILAVANQPGGFNRALLGHYPPGSTFKVVTAAALLADGLAPQDHVQCAKTANVGGREIRNFEHEEFGDIDFLTAFAKSCNTAFATQATQRLSKQQLVNMARQFGLNTPISAGVPAARSSFPSPADTVEFAAESFGQARVSVTPLTMAAVAAAVKAGGWRAPRLVVSPAVPGQAKATPLNPSVTANLKNMMSAVVTSGTAAGANLPAGTYGKTGTAEYGTGSKPPTHAWFIGFRGDLAFAVIVEGGGTGGEVAAPLAGTFLRAVG
jgi:hypothetical protein